MQYGPDDNTTRGYVAASWLEAQINERHLPFLDAADLLVDLATDLRMERAAHRRAQAELLAARMAMSDRRPWFVRVFLDAWQVGSAA